MKKRNLVLCAGALLLCLGLASCGSTPTSSSSTSDQPNTSVSDSTSEITTETTTDTTLDPTITYPPVVMDWPTDVANSMIEVIGEKLPYFEVLNAYDYGVETDDEGEYFYLLEESGDTDQTAIWGQALTGNGYVLLTTDSSLGYNIFLYTKETTEGNIIAQIDYYPGSDEFEAGMEVYAWIVTPVEYLTGWTEEQKIEMKGLLGEEIPFVENVFSIESELLSEDGVYYITDPNGDQTQLEIYNTALVNDFNYVYNEEDDTYYKVSTLNDEYQICIETYIDAIFGGLCIDAYCSMIPVESTTWPAEKIAEILTTNFTREIPSISASNYLYIYDTNYILLQLNANSDAVNAFVEALTNIDIVSTFTYDDDQLVSISSVDFYGKAAIYTNLYENDIITVQINYIESVDGELVDEFPIADINSLLGVEDSKIPTVEIGEGEQYRVDSDADLKMMVIYALDKENTFCAAYEQKLVEGGWTVTSSNGVYTAINAELTIELIFETNNALFSLTIDEYKTESNFDFTNEDQITTKGADVSIWTSGECTLTVTKGTSTTNVGNTSYFSNPFRFYKGQIAKIACSSEFKIETVTIITTTKQYASALAGSTITGATAAIDAEISNKVVLTVDPEASVSEITFTGSKVFISSLTVDYAKK